MKKQQNNFAVESHHNMRNGTKSYSVRKVENHYSGMLYLTWTK